MHRKVVQPDGLYTPTIKPHSEEKIRRHNLYAKIFATSMKNKWPQRAYIGLYSGAGLAKVEGAGATIQTTALGALEEDFTHYVFVDADTQCIEALEQRATPYAGRKTIHFLNADANNCVDKIKTCMPPYSRSNGLLSFCFVDPFSAALKFSTLRALSALRMDFLILIAAGVDVRRNWWKYLHDENDTRIAQLIDCPDWRREFRASGGRSPVRFVLRKFDDAMAGLGYNVPDSRHHHAVKTGGVLLYYLSFYSKHKLGQTFWDAVLETASPQTSLDLPSP